MKYVVHKYNKNRGPRIELCGTHQLGPRYEGQQVSDGGPYSPFRSILLVLIHDYIITHVLGPTGSDGHEWLIDADAGCAPFSLPFVAMGVV